MKFDLPISGDVARILRKTEKEYFGKAHPKSTDPQKHVHREWVRDVISIFADKTHLSFAQAVHAIRDGDFINVRPTHLRMKMNTPEKIVVAGEKRDNPLYLSLKAIDDMQLPDYADWMRKSFDFAISLSHPLKKVGGRGASEPDRITESRIADRIIKHADETRQAHIARMNAALQLALDGGAERLLQKVRDTLGPDEESMSMKLRKEPADA